MRPLFKIILFTVVLALVVVEASAQAQSWQPPADADRCPAKWGAGDQRGSGNHMKPETVLRAVKLIHTLTETATGPTLRRREPT